MILFISAAILHLCIRIFLVIKLGKKEFLTKTSVLILTLVGTFSSLIMFYTKMVSHIKDQFHPAISLIFNILGVSLLWYLFISNKDAVELVKKKIRNCNPLSSSIVNHQNYNNTSFSSKKYNNGLRTSSIENIKNIEKVESVNDESNTEITWVGIVKIVNLDQHKGRAILVNRIAEV